MIKNFLGHFLVVGVLFFALPAAAATLQMSPATGVYTINSTFTARVTVSSDGKSINAAEGELIFNPSELQVISVNRSTSVFNLWVTEPSFSNSAGTISFSGGSPTGYTGNGGTVFTVTFKSLRAGTPRINFSTGSVLANDGKGTNVLTSMAGGTFTVEAVASVPAAEVVEYVAPAYTPAAPAITSATHINGEWSAEKVARLQWSLPPDVLAVRTLLDSSPSSIPTKVYDDPISTITLDDLPEGKSYFHLQLQNDEGWGKVSHFGLFVDSNKPKNLTVALPENADLSNPVQSLVVKSDNEGSPLAKFLVRIDDEQPQEFLNKDESGILVLPPLKPGRHTVIVEAFDAAGNSEIATYSFTLDAFAAPVFTDFPREISEEVIPVLRGHTRSNAEVFVKIGRVGADAAVYPVRADNEGLFTFIADSRLSQGVYEVRASAVDENGAQSLESDVLRIAVQQPGYVRIGTLLISVLSIVVPTIGLLALTILSCLWLLWSIRRFRGRVTTESKEVSTKLAEEFMALDAIILDGRKKLAAAKRTKQLTNLEEEIFDSLQSSLTSARMKLAKEAKDVEEVVDGASHYSKKQ